MEKINQEIFDWQGEVNELLGKKDLELRDKLDELLDQFEKVKEDKIKALDDFVGQQNLKELSDDNRTEVESRLKLAKEGTEKVFVKLGAGVSLFDVDLNFDANASFSANEAKKLSGEIEIFYNNIDKPGDDFKKYFDDRLAMETRNKTKHELLKLFDEKIVQKVKLLINDQSVSVEELKKTRRLINNFIDEIEDLRAKALRDQEAEQIDQTLQAIKKLK